MIGTCWTGPGILRRWYVHRGLRARGPVALPGGRLFRRLAMPRGVAKHWTLDELTAIWTHDKSQGTAVELAAGLGITMSAYYSTRRRLLDLGGPEEFLRQRLLSGVGHRAEDGDGLTKKERDVLVLVCAGLTNKEIGRVLFITADAVKSRVRHILEAMTTRTRVQAALAYAERVDAESREQMVDVLFEQARLSAAELAYLGRGEQRA